ncbi:hypothetical protein GW7_20787 [Heterocephalus glaber]|uniref:Uncharacterized protein n=1 Tax=Heterocephalus glaber TaxID=10181 RepID=G5C115_HETGA|nr:hypothetical protein GW7_20787 [Heterocephalus glaber]
MVSAPTHSAAVKRLLRVSVQPLIAELWFPLRRAAPPPPAQPHQEARGGLVELQDARDTPKARLNFPPAPSRARLGIAARPPAPRLGGATPAPATGIPAAPVGIFQLRH